MSENIIKALKTAIRIEKEGLRAYLKLAKETKDETSKNMFIILADDELTHLEILQEQLEEHAENNKWKKVQIEESQIQKIMPKIGENMIKRKGKEGIEQIDALKVAIQMEKDSMAFYTQQMNDIDDTAMKDLFRILAEMEEAHYKIQEAELDHIQGNGFWFNIQEFSLEAD